MEEIKDRLDFTIKESDKILKHFNDTQGDDIHLFCFYMIERLNFSSRGLVPLLKDFTSQSQLEYCCGIIMRTVLLDYMIVLNAYVIILEDIDSKDFKEKLNKFCSTMLSDCVNHTLNDVQKLRIPEEDLKMIYRGIAKIYSDCLEPYPNDGSKPIPLIKNSDYSNGKLFEKLFNSKELRKYSNVYQGYLFYSKYDHFGRMYYDIARHDTVKKIYRMNESIKLFPRMLMFTLSILLIFNQQDNFLIEELGILMKYNDSY